MMTLIEELRDFLKSIFGGFMALLVLSFFFFAFGVKEILIYGKIYFLPLPTESSFAVDIFKKLQHDFLPSGVHLIVTNPLSAFIAEMEISLLLAFLIVFPFFLYKIFQYLAPALFKHEKKLLLQSLSSAILLFFLGCLFSYFFLIPATFKILYPFATNIGATPFFSLEEFMSSVFSLMVITGIMFLLPIFMVLLSFLGIVKPDFWISKLRFAALFFLIFTAIITPDGTGITMLILFFPLIGLYLIGCLLTGRFKKRNMDKYMENRVELEENNQQ